MESREQDLHAPAEYAQVLHDLSLRTALISVEGVPSGTGVLVGKDLILTAAHVINASNWPQVASKSIATVLDYRPQPGLVLLRPVSKFPLPVSFAVALQLMPREQELGAKIGMPHRRIWTLLSCN